MMILSRTTLAVWFPAVAAFAVVAASAAAGEIQTLTDQFGRTVRAEVLALEGDQLKVRREDGQVFTLSLKTLDPADQARVRAEAEASARVVPPNSVVLECSRGCFETKKELRQVTLTTGALVPDGITETKEKWGYVVTLKNQAPKALADLRVEYALFAKPDREPGKDSQPAPLRRQDGRERIASLGTRARTEFRTSTVDVVKIKLKPGIVWSETGNNAQLRDTLYGLWLRVYSADGKLVAEFVSPESLRSTETPPEGSSR